MSDVTRILSQIESGDPSAADKLLPLVYDELRKLAAAKLAREKPGQTLQATALVHEAYLRLMGNTGANSFAHQRHFFAAAAEAMRRILVDQARRKLSVRHGGQWQRVGELTELLGADSDAEQTVAVDELLDQFSGKYSRQAEVAKMRIFMEFTLKEIADVLGVSADTAESDWAFARCWLKREWGKTQ